MRILLYLHLKHLSLLFNIKKRLMGKAAETKKNGAKSVKKSWWKDERTRKIAGVLLLFAGVYLTLAFISYIFQWKEDQDQVFGFTWATFWDNQIILQNWCGRLGAIAASFFIYWGFGMASFLFLPFVFRLGWRWLSGIKGRSLTMHFAYVLALIIYLSVFFEAFFIRTAFPWGGAIGEAITHYIGNFAGEVGLYALLLLVILVIMVWSLNPNFAGIDWLKYWPFHRPVMAMAGGGGTAAEPKMEKPTFYTAPKTGEIQPEVDTELPHYNKYGQLEFVIPVTDQPGKGESKSDVDQLFEVTSAAVNPAPEKSAQKPDLELEESDLLADLDHLENLQVVTNPVEEPSDKPKHLDLSSPYDPTRDLPDYHFPTLDLLEDYDDQKVEIDRSELEANKDQIIATLSNYKIEITKIRATIGPTVTLYEIIPAPGVRISKIKNLEDDIALSLSALGIRIIAPIPGKGTIGIEVPNKKKQIVSLKDVLQSEKFTSSNMDLPIAVGKTIANEVFVADLAKMPHLLIAGATGQGKSVGINAILLSLLYKKHPSELKLILIDPKKVELYPYGKLKDHFLSTLPNQEEPITTETSRVVNLLNSLCIEMETRYDLLKKARARHIKEYNKKFVKRELNPENGHRFLPFIVLVIDEFADLIMTAGKEIELPIARLAQLARAVGIHLVIATQRPSVNIITGIIKANFPARIAYKVTQKVDSRTIIDYGGAEQLIGRGDMLLSVGGDIVRVQSAFVDTPEVESVIECIAKQPGYEGPYLLPEYKSPDEDGDGEGALTWSEVDGALEEAARLVVANQLGSTSMIQRRMKLGYNRAGRIMDQLEALGIVGAADGSKPREVLVFSEIELDYLLDELKKKG